MKRTIAKLRKDVEEKDTMIAGQKQQHKEALAALTVDLLKNSSLQELEGAKNQQVTARLEELKVEIQSKKE